eukprot:SAG11_NODE_9645_length_892_cov_3.827238_1_plen_183_part_00
MHGKTRYFIWGELWALRYNCDRVLVAVPSEGPSDSPAAAGRPAVSEIFMPLLGPLWLLLALSSCRAAAAADHQQPSIQFGTITVSGDVRLYGADPAPGNDDTAALRRALANCSQTGGQVFFPAGTYTVSHPVPVGWHPQMGEVLNKQSVPGPILPVPSHCTVFGEGNRWLIFLGGPLGDKIL